MKLAFLHIPKTAGTTLHKVISDNLGPIVWYPPRTTEELTQKFQSSFDAFERHLMKGAVEEQRELLAQLDAYPAIGGHTPERSLRLFYPRFTVTSLRDPTDRFISWYFHYVFPENPNHKREYRSQTEGMSIEEFAQFAPIFEQNDNIAVRYFANVPKARAVGPHDVERAKYAIMNIDAVLFQSSLDEDLKSLCARLGWDYEPTQLKVGTKRKKVELEFDRTVLEPFLKYDNVLFNFAKERLGK